MIGNLTVNISAKDPTRKCEKFLTFLNSPSTVRIVGVPSAVGKWKITKVYFSINYPDNTSVSKECTAGAGVYVATVAGSSVAGTSVNGYTVTANATDETGASVTGFILGKGDVVVANADGTITAGETTYYIHVLDSQPTTPKKGDAYVDTGYWKVYNGSSWVTLGGAFGSAQYVQYPVSEGGDGKWHRVIISDGAIAYDETGVDEPPTCATQSWVTTQIAAETTARTAAISTEATARQSADQTNAAAITAEAAARASADEAEVTNRNSAIASAIATEVTDRNAAIATETAARTAAVSAEATARANADTAEATARDSAIASAIATEVTNRNSAISTSVAAEKTRAEGAEDELNDAIVNEVARASAAEATKVPLSGAATISGVKTFTSSPVVPTPTANMEAATKRYADDVVASEASARASAVSAEATARNAAIATAIAVGTSGNDLVHKSGTETITGAKTFSESVITNSVFRCKTSGVYGTDAIQGKFWTSGSDGSEKAGLDTTISAEKGIVHRLWGKTAGNVWKRMLEVNMNSDASEMVLNCPELTTVFGSAFAYAGMPSTTYVDIITAGTIPTTIPDWTATFNGWITLSMCPSEAYKDKPFGIDDVTLGSFGIHTTVGDLHTLKVVIPCVKGHTYHFWYGGSDLSDKSVLFSSFYHFRAFKANAEVS